MATKKSAPLAEATLGSMQAGAGHATFEAKMEGAGFDPTIIITIIGALIPLLANCFKPSPQSVRRSASVPRVANALREKDETIGWLESRHRAREVLAVLADASDPEVQAFINDCCE